MALPKFIRDFICPLALILGTPLLIVIFNHIIQDLHGDIPTTIAEISEYGVYGFIAKQCILNNLPSLNHYFMILTFYISQIILYYAVPGKAAKGPMTSTGYVPKYKENGVATYCISICIVIFGYFVFGVPFHALFDHLTPIIIAICILSWIVTFILMLCAMFNPEWKADVQWASNPILSYWRGWELYPYWFGINCKQLINSRIGMTQWALICVSFILKDYDNMKQLSTNQKVEIFQVLCSPVFISGSLQIIYLFKFFWWEIGYFGTLDVMYDRCGFYISWGCLSWVFSVYTFHSGIILSHKLHQSAIQNDSNYFCMHAMNAFIVFVIGIISIYVNYDADDQKIRVREANGQCQVWGKNAKIIRATYVNGEGKKKKSILLISGYWGLSRHFHYIPELMFALMICIPTQIASSLQLFYFVYLFILLADRTGRDDDRCRKKYGKFWTKYCAQVRYKMIPYVW